MRIILFTLLLAFSGVGSTADFNYRSYETATLSDAANSFELVPTSAYVIDGAMRKYHVKGTFTGNIRKVDSGLKKFIAGWAIAVNVSPKIPAILNTAVEIRQGSTTFWMPIQDQLLKPFVEEVAPNSKVHVFILLLGAYNQTPVFIMNEFSAAE